MVKVTYPREGTFFVRPNGRFVKRAAGETITFRSKRIAKIYTDAMNEWNGSIVCQVVA